MHFDKSFQQLERLTFKRGSCLDRQPGTSNSALLAATGLPDTNHLLRCLAVQWSSRCPTLSLPEPLALTAAAVFAALLQGPALAGPAENALLASYAGNYIGTGNITGAHAQSVKCRLVLNASTNGKVIYTGRCSTSGAEFSLTGTFAYADGHYLAAMTGGGATGSVVGQKQGDGVVFKAAKQHSSMGGQSMTVGSTLTLAGGKITVAFSTTDDTTGATSAGTIPFTKS